jgi:N-acetylmuramoyl-L-alanine amidase
MEALGIQTDDEVEVYFPYHEAIEEMPMPYPAIVISSGHGKYVRGASGILDEVDEARKVVNRLADELQSRGVEVTTFHDDSSNSQDENLHTIVAFHNSETRNLDVSVHFNAFEQTSKPMGCEVLYVTQGTLASQVSAAIAGCGFINRGGKKRSDLYFLNNTDEPAILLEVCFVDSTADAEIYRAHFERICDAIADVLGGAEETEGVPPPVVPEPATGRVDIEVSGNVTVTINGVVVTS